MSLSPTLDPLQRRIIGALQVDPRAPWRKIARALGEAERTVARHGTELLAINRVTVAGIENRQAAIITSFTCTPVPAGWRARPWRNAPTPPTPI